MLFVAVGTNVSVVIRNGVVRKIADEHGNLQTITDRPTLYADFQARRLTENQRVIAKRQFILRHPKAPFGAAPYEQSDIMGGEFSVDEVMPGSFYTGHDPGFNLSRFDTREDIPYEEQGAFSDEDKAELKQIVEAKLLEHAGKDYIRIDDSLPKPWPSYPVEQGAGVAQKIVAAAREFGIPFREVWEFEKTQENPRAGVLSLLEAEVKKDAEAAAEDASLSVEIPA